MDLDEKIILRCKKELPKTLIVDGINYKLHVHTLLSGGFRIIYSEFNNNTYNWNNKLISLFYEIVKELPPKKEYKKNDLKNNIIYITKISDAISDCLKRLNQWQESYTEPKKEKSIKHVVNLFISGCSDCPMCDMNDTCSGYSCNLKEHPDNFIKETRKGLQPITPDWCPIKHNDILFKFK